MHSARPPCPSRTAEAAGAALESAQGDAQPMPRDTDFLELYEALGVAPDCSPEAFRQAYRRRVAELHPDRADAGASDLERLQKLNAAYARALDFQRRHGRLPGAPAPSAARAVPATEAVAAVSAASRPAAAPPAAAPRSGALFGAIGLAVVLAAIALGAFDDASAPAPQPPAETQRAAAPQPVPGRRIELGTSKAAVRALLGAPLLETENRWDYGPSWVTFRCEVVNGWYSSPLRPLGTSSSHPGESTLPPPRC
ncbi:MAG: hypothetical protein DI564_11005 [Rhodanobacter denitrificans]|uniref:J domain-containing protein n=1 Tax=Rhodanobacter denitrificans TaxID=666685 RepID=A0A2W5KDF8_9GAMM|nr:MAG: hypothetical protein DI564_11005 [Rhodanobacter denitrificans]